MKTYLSSKIKKIHIIRASCNSVLINYLQLYLNLSNDIINVDENKSRFEIVKKVMNNNEKVRRK